MNKEICTGGIETIVSNVAKVMVDEGVRMFIVTENVKDIPVPLGVVTRSDIVFRVVAKGRNPRETPVKYIFSAPVITIDEHATDEELSELLHTKKIRSAIVVDEDNKIVGICGEDDIVKNIRKNNE